jgi:hypothetical protein
MALPDPTIESVAAGIDALQQDQTRRNVQDHLGLVQALKDALQDDSPNGWALLQRVPLICNDIREIKNNIRWMTWIGSGIVIGVGMIALKALGGA